MKRVLIGHAVALCAIGLMGCSAHDRCLYNGTLYPEDATSCQPTLSQFKCQDGDWHPVGKTCGQADVAAFRSCDYAGINYASGSASCQAGRQFRCEGGTWQNLGVPCAVGDVPIRAVPSGRTCMYEGATVSSNSTICRSGTTYLCSDGQWENLGTLCR